MYIGIIIYIYISSASHITFAGAGAESWHSALSLSVQTATGRWVISRARIIDLFPEV